jgi:predicted acylesterase/phospholipase RssA
LNRLPDDELALHEELESGIGGIEALVVDTPPTIGFALSGGGSRGAFGVGALEYLTNVMQLGAAVVTGTSVGALSALKVAAFAPGAQGVATTQLAGMWTGLTRDDEMWEWEPWAVPVLDSSLFGSTLRDYLEGFLGIKRTRDLYGPRTFTVGSDVFASEWESVQTAVLSAAAIATAIDHVPALSDAFKRGEVLAFTNLGPTERLVQMEVDLKKVRENEKTRTVQLRLATTCLETGQLRYVTGTGAILERDNQTPVRSITSRQDDPACAELAAALRRLQDSAKPYNLQPGVEPEDIQPAINQKKLQLAACRRQHPPREVTSPAVVDVVKGAMASAAAPTFFRPQVFFDETYVDGGIRELTPVEVAFQCGADLVYAISESALQLDPTDITVPGLTPRPGSGFTDLISIAGRSLAEITLDEIANDDLRGFGDAISVIAPTFNVFSGLVIDPGLIDIWIDYGLMRAADVVTLPPGTDDPRSVTGSKAIELSDHLTRLRVAVWLAEHVMANARIVQIAITHGPHGFLPRWQEDGASIPWDPTTALDWIRVLRVLEKALVDRRESRGLLAGRTTTSFLNGWERHPFTVPGTLWPNPTTRLRFPNDPPARRLLRDMGSHRLFQILPTGAVVEISSPAAASPAGTSSEVSAMPPGLIDAIRAP